MNDKDLFKEALRTRNFASLKSALDAYMAELDSYAKGPYNVITEHSYTYDRPSQSFDVFVRIISFKEVAAPCDPDEAPVSIARLFPLLRLHLNLLLSKSAGQKIARRADQAPFYVGQIKSDYKEKTMLIKVILNG